MTPCEDLKTRALEAVRVQDLKREQDYRDSLKRQDEEAYKQLKEVFPLLTRDEQGFELCGYRFRSRMMGWDVTGKSSYALIPQNGFYGPFVNDEASFGRFLLDIARKEQDKPSKGFWASLFS